MNPKKKPKDPAAQNLIDSLLDESNASGGGGSASGLGPREFELPDSGGDTASIHIDFGAHKDSSSPVAVSSPVRDESAEDATIAIAVPESSSRPSLSLKTSLKTNTETNAGNNSENSVNAIENPKSHSDQDGESTLQQPHILPAASSTADSHATQPLKVGERSEVDRQVITELKTVVKLRDLRDRSDEVRPGGRGVASSADAALKQAENLRIAQSRINELEAELERIRRENEKLAAAGETLRRRSDELLSKLEQQELQSRENERIHGEEKKVVRGQMQSKDREIVELRGRLEEMEGRLESNFKKIRVRERELEHRLEIVRMESQTLVASKDKMILELKRQIDQITHENDYAKQKAQEHFNQVKDKQETIRRVVRALRIALTILEGDDENGSKKSD